jgi:Protein of unknown function (DUF3137)
MSDDRLPGDDREEPPFVLGLLMGSAARFESAVRRVMAAIDRRVQFFIWGAGTLVMFLGILSLSIAESPTVAGFFRGIATGLFLALLFAAGFGWLLLWAHGSTSRKFDKATAAPADLETLLGPTLRELNAVRKDVIRNVKARSVTRVPLGVAASVAVWVLAQWNDDPPGALEMVMFVIVGAVAGELWAASKLEGEYRRLYKDRVLPRLAARLGNLTYRQAASDGVRKLSAGWILPEFDSAESDDEIVGTHRGLEIDIVEARLRRRSGQNTQVVFDGLVIELTLPRSLTGTTVVLTDEGVFGNLKARWRSGAMEAVRLEDPRFEQRYEVYSNDQIEARALLTPAFMERFMALSSLSGFSLPGALAEGNRLVVALPKGMGTGDLFEPPVYWKPAGGRALLALEDDIRAVLRMADTVIELDFWAVGRARDAKGAG